MTSKPMLLWIDDTRPMPEGFTHWAKTYDEAINYLKTNQYSFVSFDHDLGFGKTGYDIAKYVAQNAHNIHPFQWSIHSMNPVGADNIRAVMYYVTNEWEAAVH